MSAAIHGHAEAVSAFSKREMRMGACARENAPTVVPTTRPHSGVILSGKTMANDTDAQIHALLRRSGWPEPERDAPGLPTARAAVPVDTVGHPAPKKRRGANRGKSCTLAEIPPFCHAPATATPEQAALAAARALGIPQDDTLGRWVLLLQFRRALKTTKGTNHGTTR